MSKHDRLGAPDKSYLRMLLQEAAVLEHQFMCQYLYAAFSLKKNPDPSCSEVEFEHVRRWASTLYMIARQEMEHLSVVNSILTATGLDPCLWRFGFPTQSAWFTAEARAGADGDPEPCDLPFVLARFDLTTVRRFMCMESPLPADVPARYQATVHAWCFKDGSGQCPCAPQLGAPPPVARFEHTTVRAAAPPGGVSPGTVQLLYEAIGAELDRLVAAYGEPAVFSGHASGQSELPTEYDVYLFPICDLASAQAGVRMIKEQGEGLSAPAQYTSHFEHFADMAADYESVLAANPGFVPSVPLPLDPSNGSYPNPVAVEAAQIFDRGYYLLLQMLTSYYAYYRRSTWKSPPFLAAAMEQAAFAPMMTMFVRSLAEVMAMIPTGNGDERTGASFFLPVSLLRTLQNPSLPQYSDINHFIDGVAALVVALTDLQSKVPPEATAKVEFIVQTMTRVALKLGYVYQDGIFAKFDPNNPDQFCEHEDTCS